MEKRKRIETRLPESMIQLIQSLLSEEEAARTTLISKSWYNAWLTRPVLVLRNLDDRSSSATKFSKFAMKTMQRYQDSNLKIEGLRLKLRSDGTLGRRLIVDAMKLGATDLNIEFKSTKFDLLDLPAEVLGSETLLRLSLIGCEIDGNVKCSMLKSLCLDNVVLKSGGMLESITSCRNSIEELSLSNSYHISNDGKLLSGKDLPELHRLKRLHLEEVEVDYLFFDHLEYRFPCLEDMSLVRCHCIAIRVKSSSLQRISIVQRIVQPDVSSSLELDVPNLAVFSYSGGSAPWPVYIKARDECCESHVSMECHRIQRSSWYAGLHRLLAQLSPSRINLTITMAESRPFTEMIAGVNDDIPVVARIPVAVENLRLETKYDAGCFLRSLFRICRPKLVTHRLLDQSLKYLLELTGKGVVEKVNVELQPWKAVFMDGKIDSGLFDE